MIQRVRIGILALVLGLMLLHFSLIGLYVNPLQKGTEKNFWGQWYAYPFFSQGWNLFVPVPSSNYYIFCEYTSNGKQIREEIFQSIVSKHRQCRLAGYEPMVVALSNSIHYFEHSVENDSTKLNRVTNSLYFDILCHMVKSIVKNRHKEEISGLRIVLLIDPLRAGNPRVYFSGPSVS